MGTTNRQPQQQTNTAVFKEQLCHTSETAAANTTTSKYIAAAAAAANSLESAALGAKANIGGGPREAHARACSISGGNS